jgi:Zn-dependent protease
MEIITVFFLLALIISIIIHEVSHGFAAEMLGDPTARLAGRLTLNPVPHIDPFGSVIIPALLVLTGSPFLFGWAKPVPYNPYNLRDQKWGEAIVAAAGPGINIVIAVAFGLVVRFGIGELPMSFVSLAALIVYINILLALFNLLPIPPLDGSKLLKAVLPFRANMAYQKFESTIMSAGMLGLILVLFLFITLIGPVFSAFMSMLFTLLTGQSVGVALSGLAF